MPIEVEIKLRLENVEATRDQIARLGGQFHLGLIQHDTYFNMPEGLRDFARTDEALRLRVTDELAGDPPNYETPRVTRTVADLTYKGAKLDAQTKSRKEVRAVIEDAGAMRAILAALGFVEVITIRKERAIHALPWRGREVELTIDAIEHLPGNFMELEVIVDQQGAFAAARDDLLALLRELGFTEEDSIRESYLELVARALGRQLTR